MESITLTAPALGGDGFDQEAYISLPRAPEEVYRPAPPNVAKLEGQSVELTLLGSAGRATTYKGLLQRSSSGDEEEEWTVVNHVSACRFRTSSVVFVVSLPAGNDQNLGFSFTRPYWWVKAWDD